MPHPNCHVGHAERVKLSEVQPDPNLRYAVSYGLGADSTAVLLRWFHEPETRPAPWNQIVVLSAMTGDEWKATHEQVVTHILPVLRAAGVRYIQVARSQRHVRKDGTGIEVLSDSRSPHELHSAGAYRLSMEMLSAGTLPQLGGSRLCSVHAKGDILDPLLDRLFEGRPYHHVMGFEANEQVRADKDTTFNTPTRTGMYPLIEWGFTRADVLSYIESHAQERWVKSACTFCPFALSSKSSRAETLRRYAADPEVAADALLMEGVALALNPAQSLIGRSRLVDVVGEEGLAGVLAAYDRLLSVSEHAVYRVRRIYRAASGDPTKKSPRADRSVQRIIAGDRAEMMAAVATYADLGADIDTDDGGRIVRAHVRRRGELYPTVEEFFVAAPAVVGDKQATHFDRWWSELTGKPVSLQLF